MPWVVVVLLGAGLFLTLRLRFVQVRRFAEACRAAFVGRRARGATGALTPFQAFMTALAASIGTGNIAGVATAIVSGGPGALFWIWVLRLRRDGDQVQRGRARRDVPRDARGGRCCRGRCTTCATACGRRALAWIFALVAGGRGAHDDAVHAAELDGAGAEHQSSAFPSWIVRGSPSRC